MLLTWLLSPAPFSPLYCNPPRQQLHMNIPPRCSIHCTPCTEACATGYVATTAIPTKALTATAVPAFSENTLHPDQCCPGRAGWVFCRQRRDTTVKLDKKQFIHWKLFAHGQWFSLITQVAEDRYCFMRYHIACPCITLQLPPSITSHPLH